MFSSKQFTRKSTQTHTFSEMYKCFVCGVDAAVGSSSHSINLRYDKVLCLSFYTWPRQCVFVCQRCLLMHLLMSRSCPLCLTSSLDVCVCAVFVILARPVCRRLPHFTFTAVLCLLSTSWTLLHLLKWCSLWLAACLSHPIYLWLIKIVFFFVFIRIRSEIVCLSMLVTDRPTGRPSTSTTTICFNRINLSCVLPSLLLHQVKGQFFFFCLPFIYP